VLLLIIFMICYDEVFYYRPFTFFNYLLVRLVCLIELVGGSLTVELISHSCTC